MIIFILNFDIIYNLQIKFSFHIYFLNILLNLKKMQIF